MSKRPLSVTVIGWLFVLAGFIGLAYHASDFVARRPWEYDLVLVCFVRLLAILFGVFLLRGRDWARWGLIIWMAYHVILSGFHSVLELVMHSVLLALIAYFLFRPEVSAYFRGWRQER
jgi:hypothetical protein